MSAPTLASEGIVTIMVLKMILKNLAFFISLKILPILKALAIVVYLAPMFVESVFEIIIIVKDIITMIRSKIFHPYLKY